MDHSVTAQVTGDAVVIAQELVTSCGEGRDVSEQWTTPSQRRSLEMQWSSHRNWSQAAERGETSVNSGPLRHSAGHWRCSGHRTGTGHKLRREGETSVNSGPLRHSAGHWRCSGHRTGTGHKLRREGETSVNSGPLRHSAGHWRCSGHRTGTGHKLRRERRDVSEQWTTPSQRRSLEMQWSSHRNWSQVAGRGETSVNSGPLRHSAGHWRCSGHRTGTGHKLRREERRQ